MRQRSTCSNIYDKAERESISLKGIDAGLKEMQERKRSGKRAKHLEELINEL